MNVLLVPWVSFKNVFVYIISFEKEIKIEKIINQMFNIGYNKNEIEFI